MKPIHVGFICGVTYILFKLALYITQSQYTILTQGQWIPLFIFVGIGILYSITKYVKSNNEFDWIKAFKAGISVSLVAAVVSGIYLYIHYSMIDPDFLEYIRIQRYNTAKLVPNITAEQLAQDVEKTKTLVSPSTFSVFLMFSLNSLGLVASLTIAMMAKVFISKK